MLWDSLHAHVDTAGSVQTRQHSRLESHSRKDLQIVTVRVFCTGAISNPSISCFVQEVAGRPMGLRSIDNRLNLSRVSPFKIRYRPQISNIRQLALRKIRSEVLLDTVIVIRRDRYARSSRSHKSHPVGASLIKGRMAWDVPINRKAILSNSMMTGGRAVAMFGLFYITA